MLVLVVIARMALLCDAFDVSLEGGGRSGQGMLVLSNFYSSPGQPVGVCHQGAGDSRHIADVICNQLGFEGGGYTYSGYGTPPSGMRFVEWVDCGSGEPQTLSECRYNTELVTVTQCFSDDYLGISCGEKLVTTPEPQVQPPPPPSPKPPVKCQKCEDGTPGFRKVTVKRLSVYKAARKTKRVSRFKRCTCME